MDQNVQKDNTHYDPRIVPGPIFVAIGDSRLVYQLKNERENDGGGNRFAKLNE